MSGAIPILARAGFPRRKILYRSGLRATIAPMIRSIMYYSSAVRAMSAEELAALEQECELNAIHVGITGMLLHKHGEFLQVLEGPKGVVGDMYARILVDPRHTVAGKISDRPIARREFEGATLRFRNLDTAPAGTPFLTPFSYEAFRANPDLALLVLKYFFCNQGDEPAPAESWSSATPSLV